MKKPTILSEVENYSLIPEDFETPFEKYVFMTIANLAKDGAETIGVIDVDGYIGEKPNIKAIFDKFNGIEYLQDAMEIADTSNFKYYYTKLKKYNALKDLKNIGYDTNRIYPEGDLLDEKDYELREKFDNLEVADIFKNIKADIASAEVKYGCSSAVVAKANTGIRELIQKLKTEPEIGAPCQGSIFNTITRGARKGKYYVLSAMSGGSKTRTMIGNACYIAYPIRFDQTSQQWVNCGSCEKVLYVGTEQVLEEIQTMIVAYLTGLNEDVIIGGYADEEQTKLIEQAIEVMEIYSDNFIVAQLPEPNLGQVRTLLRHYCINEQRDYVFYDYIFSTPSLLGEFRDLGVRVDVALRLLSTLLKDLAVELDCFIMTATQITGSIEFKAGYIRNYMLLRDSKSIPDKADFAAIKAKVLPEELNLLDAVCQEYGAYPNQVTDVYKMRRGRWVDVRVWSLADLGTCRTRDLFVTDANLVPIPDFEIRDILLDYDEMDKTNNTLKLLNTGEVVEEKVEIEEDSWEDMF